MKKTAKAKTPKNAEFDTFKVNRIQLVLDNGSIIEISKQKSRLGIWWITAAQLRYLSSV